MSDSNCSSSNNNHSKYPLPPPRSGNDSGGGPPPSPPHATTEAMPNLSSAPPSGNYYDWNPQLQQQQMHQQMQQMQQMMPTTMPPPPPPLPPPPPVMPPPPLPQQQQQQYQQQQQQQYQQHPHIVQLPPPPPMPTQSRSTSPAPSMASRHSSVSSTSGTSSVAQPPPPITTTGSATYASPLPPPPIMSGLAKTPTASLATTATNINTSSHSSNSNASSTNTPPPTTTPTTTTTNWIPPKTEPPAIPLTAHCPSNIRYLAHRQSHINILVIGTESAHRMAWKNQLRLTDLMEGLARSLSECSTRAIPPFRSVTRSMSLSWRDVPLTFCTPEELAVPMDYDVAQDLLQQQAQLQDLDGNLNDELNVLEDQVDSLLQSESTQDSFDHMADYEARIKQEEQVVKDAFALTSTLDIPWLLRYRHALDASTDQMPHELFSCPPVCLLVCTTQEANPLVDTLRELGSKHYLPHCLNNGMYDPKTIRQEALVLHDTVQGPRDWDEAGLRSQLQRHFGPNASIIRMNGILPQTALQLSQEEVTDEWGGGGQCGNCLSHSDRVVWRQYLESLTTSSVLPALERRLSDLNVIVSDRKKGVKNVFKSFWRKPKEANPEDTINKATGEIAYRFDSIESQTRLLADTLFLVKDYEAALGMYRLIRDDYKLDKAMMHYASVQEMMALCMYFLDPYSRARDIVSHIETALLGYSKAAEDERPTPAGQNKNLRPNTATHATRCATRLCLWLASTSENILSGRHLEVADLLASASSHETSLGAAVLLEQSSAQYYHAEMYRKYAFHMLMSGHMFRTAQQEAHAFRCFTSALYLYRDRPWNELHNHLRSALAAQLYSMGRMSVSVQLYAKLVGIPSGGSVSVKSQQKFVNNLLFICNEHPKKALVGADRMAAPAELSSRERDRYRQERLDGIVQVIQYTKGAQRILELPRVQLPTVVDESLVVETPEDSVGRTSGPSLLGVLEKGSESVWEELKIMTTAELRAADASKVQKMDDEVTTKALARIEDYDIRRVIAQIDKAKQYRSLLERNKRSRSYKGETPPIRARGEPLRVVFTLTNPLSIPVDMSDMQLVARMTDEEGRLFTNLEAIHISRTKTEGRTWTFQSSDMEFQVPEFSRLSPESQSGDRAWVTGDDFAVPYFAVSKQSVSLDAQGQTSIALGICPLVQGNLEILGVRSRLMDDVWVYHPFQVKGPRLHNTRANRANRVRAEPVLLKATIKQDMPCLTAQLVRVPNQNDDGQIAHDHLLQGQMDTWILRLSNIGTAPATSISLKVNVPWIYVPSNDDDPAMDKENAPLSKILSRETQAKSCCVGPSGTCMKLPIKGPQLKQEGSIQPGESFDLPIQIKTGAEGGTQDFYMLYRYELDDPSSTSTNQPHRWLKKMYKVAIYPSLSVAASVLPSTWSKREQILSIELTNHRNDRPSDIKILLEKLSLVSRSYRMERLAGQLSGSENPTVEVDWRERVTVHYRLIPIEKEGGACYVSECPFSENTSTLMEGACSSGADYLCLKKACARFERTWKKHQIDLLRAQYAKDKEEQHPQSITQIRKANTNLGTKRQESGMSGDGGFDDVDIGTVHSTSIAKLFPAEKSHTKINLICSWSAELGGRNSGNAKVRGEHRLRSVLVRPATKTSECPITISANYPASVKHNFSQGPVLVPFHITLRNQQVKSPVKFVFEVENPKYFDFVGAESLQWKLDGSEELCIPMQAAISCPGVHNLQSVKVTIEEEDDDEPVAFNYAVQWLVNVASKV